MTEADDVDVADVGTVTSFTEITPVQYYGQEETEPYIRCSILLDGSDSPVSGIDIRDVSAEQFRVGLRVRCIWRPAAERELGDVEQPLGGHPRDRVRPLGAHRGARCGSRAVEGAQLLMSGSDDIAIIGMAQTPAYERYDNTEPTLLMTVVNQLLEGAGLDRSDVDFTIAGSCDYLSGMPFAFVANVDGVGAWPPVYESHVEMDGAWALFEAWLRLMLGDIDIALVLGSGKSSPTDARQVFPLQGDPYVTAPLGFDPVSYAGIQARALVEAGLATETDFADVVARSLVAGATNPNATRGDAGATASTLLGEPYFCSPLRRHDVSPKVDGAAGVLIARGDRARRAVRPARCGSGASTIASSHTTPDSETSPIRRRPDWLPSGVGRDRRAGRRGRAARDAQPRGDHPASGARSRRRHHGQPFGRAAVW